MIIFLCLRALIDLYSADQLVTKFGSCYLKKYGPKLVGLMETPPLGILIKY